MNLCGVQSLTAPKLDRAQVEALWNRHATGVRHFVIGVLRDPDLAEEALQQTFLTAIERGHSAAPKTQKGWLYKVAFNHAMELKRRSATGDRALTHLQDALRHNGQQVPDPAAQVAHSETVAHALASITRLPQVQRRVVEMRLFDALTFSNIAKQLNIPLSTALTRMRLALARLRKDLP